MDRNRPHATNDLYRALQNYARIYTFRDPSNASQFDLRVNECYVLDLLAEEGAMSTSQLSARLGIHKSNASRIVMALEKRGLLESRTDPDDRRAVVISPTAEGKMLHEQTKAYFCRRLEGVTGKFEIKEIETFLRIFGAIANEAEARIVIPGVAEP